MSPCCRTENNSKITCCCVRKTNAESAASAIVAFVSHFAEESNEFGRSSFVYFYVVTLLSLSLTFSNESMCQSSFEFGSSSFVSLLSRHGVCVSIFLDEPILVHRRRLFLCCLVIEFVSLFSDELILVHCRLFFCCLVIADMMQS